MSTGRSTDVRTVTVTTTNASTALTGAAGTFNTEDAGALIAGTGIPAGATLAAVASDTAATLSANATAAGSVTAVVNPATSSGYGFRGWSPETEAESKSYTVVASASGAAYPDKITNSTTRVYQRARS